MAVLNRDEFFNLIKARVGEGNSDDDLKFIEDVTDTYNALEKASTVDEAEVNQRLTDLDNSWRERYKARFFGEENADIDNDDIAIYPEREKPLNYGGLFE